MREHKDSDSPSGYDREVQPRRVVGSTPAVAVRAVQVRYAQLPARVHTDDPFSVLSRVVASAHEIARTTRDGFSHERAVNLAALALALVVAVDRAETADVTSGDDAA